MGTTTARALLGRLDLLGSPVPVVLAGGMFRAESPIFHGAIRHALGQWAPCARIVRPDVEPVVGAALAALNLLGVAVDAVVRARARATYGHAAPL